MTTALELSIHEEFGTMEAQFSGVSPTTSSDLGLKKKGLRCAQCFDSKKGCVPKDRPSGEPCDPCIRSGFICSGLMNRGAFNNLTSEEKACFKEKFKIRPLSEVIADIDCILYLKNELEESELLQSYFSPNISAEHVQAESTSALDSIVTQKRNPPDLDGTWKSLVSEAKVYVRQMLVSSNRGSEARFLSGLCAGNISYGTEEIAQDYRLDSELSAVATGYLFDKTAGLWFRWMKGYGCMNMPSQQEHNQVVSDECGTPFLGRDFEPTEDILDRFIRLLRILDAGSIEDKSTRKSDDPYFRHDLSVIGTSIIADMSPLEKLRPDILMLLVDTMKITFGLDIFDNESMPKGDGLLHLATVHSGWALDKMSPLVYRFPHLLTQRNHMQLTALQCAAVKGSLLSLNRLLDLHQRTDTSDEATFISPEQIRIRYGYRGYAMNSFPTGFPASAIMLAMLEARWSVVKVMLEFAGSNHSIGILSSSGKVTLSKLDYSRELLSTEYELFPIHIACIIELELNILGRFLERKPGYSEVVSIMKKLRAQTSADHNTLTGLLDIMLAEDRASIVRILTWFKLGIDAAFSETATQWVQNLGSPRVKKMFKNHFPYPADYNGDRIELDVSDWPEDHSSQNSIETPGSSQVEPSSPLDSKATSEKVGPRGKDMGREELRRDGTESSSGDSGSLIERTERDARKSASPLTGPAFLAKMADLPSPRHQARVKSLSPLVRHAHVSNQLPVIIDVDASPPPLLPLPRPPLRPESPLFGIPSRTNPIFNSQNVRWLADQSSVDSLASNQNREILPDHSDQLSDLEMISPPLSPSPSVSRGYIRGGPHARPTIWSASSARSLSNSGSSVADQTMADTSKTDTSMASRSVYSSMSSIASQHSSWSLGGMPFYTPRLTPGRVGSNMSASSGHEGRNNWSYYGHNLSRDAMQAGY